MEMRLPDFGPVHLFELQFLIARPLSVFSKQKGFKKKDYGIEYWATFNTEKGMFPVGLVLQSESSDLTLVVLTGGWMVPIATNYDHAKIVKLTELWNFVLSNVREWRADVELRYRIVHQSDTASPLGSMTDQHGELHITNIVFERKSLQPAPYRISVSLVKDNSKVLIYEDKFCHGTLAQYCSNNAEAVLERIMSVVNEIETPLANFSMPNSNLNKVKPHQDLN